MKHLSVAFLIVVSMTVIIACGGGSGTGGDTPQANDISVTFSGNEENSPGAFQLKETIGYISGMRYNAKSTAKLAYVVFANYPVELSLYGSIVPPKEAGQIAVIVSFKTESKEIPMVQQMEEYNKMTIPTGTYPPSWMGNEKSFQVTYWMAQQNGISISGQGASGTAALTSSTPDQVSGSIDFKSEKGSTIKGTFTAKIKKDFWKNP